MSLIRLSLLASLLLGLVSCSTLPPPPEKPVVAPPKPVVTPGDLPKTEIGPTLRPTTYAALPGWRLDNLREAWPAYASSCSVLIRRVNWKSACTAAANVDTNNSEAIRQHFETYFTPYEVRNPDGSDNGLVTGYYEPLLRGSRKRGGPYQTPLHRAPDDILTIDLASVYPELKGMRLRGRLVGNKVVAYPSRAEMAQSNSLAGKEILWVDDPIEAFFLQVQGSGRVQLADGKETVRVAYADQNGQPYKSIGRYLVDKGEMTLDQASAQSIKAWVIANPTRQQELLNANPSYVFFKEEKIADASVGPKGAMGVPLTPQRSIAIDPQYIPMGAPVFLSTTQPNSNVLLQRLMMAQDTGGAIKNAVRADFFWGFGAQAGEQAGRMKQRGTMWVLLPK
ncbi:murein transglycosylase [Herminiimonas sp. KBW02]|uniref:murein transglycosylase A n=1 Tax=Herminiimonas sp. KBW02 TaxID=2153363 RepID=UPI000F5AFD3B|nr:murein transglycosylase A [Herminiimonas sp. KBW02]RQO37435.1 murein transglycosylase [Herminiimonas sp. KBW02]